MKRRSFFELLGGAVIGAIVGKKVVDAPAKEVGPWVGKLSNPHDVIDPSQHNSWKVWEGFEPSYPTPLPTGYIATYYGDKVPEGWLPCDGSLVDYGRYPKLCEILVPLKANRIPNIPGSIIKT